MRRTSAIGACAILIGVFVLAARLQSKGGGDGVSHIRASVKLRDERAHNCVLIWR
jgi:hypothetical protein